MISRGESCARRRRGRRSAQTLRAARAGDEADADLGETEPQPPRPRSASRRRARARREQEEPRLADGAFDFSAVLLGLMGLALGMEVYATGVSKSS